MSAVFDFFRLPLSYKITQHVGFKKLFYLKTTNIVRLIVYYVVFVVSFYPRAVVAANDQDLSSVVLLLVIVIFGAIYFIPTIVAFEKGHPNRWVILIINSFFGATFFGWIILSRLGSARSFSV